jgi:hypothetical protein
MLSLWIFWNTIIWMFVCETWIFRKKNKRNNNRSRIIISLNLTHWESAISICEYTSTRSIYLWYVKKHLLFELVFRSLFFYFLFFFDLSFSFFVIHFRFRIEIILQLVRVRDNSKLTWFSDEIEANRSFFFASFRVKSYKFINSIWIFRRSIDSLHECSKIKEFFSLNDQIHVNNVHFQFHDISNIQYSNDEIELRKIFVNSNLFEIRHFFIITFDFFLDLIDVLSNLHMKFNQRLFHIDKRLNSFFIQDDFFQWLIDIRDQKAKIFEIDDESNVNILNVEKYLFSIHRFVYKFHILVEFQFLDEFRD